ncbi:MAG: TonB-dependent receptor [Parasphingopyxis sp.]|uniref:TonB-dependent receptor n=1 Tax=Parasphingopyxis sp. TaxID=1920299 RepID=UPI003F9F6E46
MVRYRYACASWVALAVGVAGQANAQVEDGSAGAEPFSGAPIVVTASRREEDLQSTPLSVSAFTDDALEVRSVQSVDQIAALTPGVQISTYQGDTSIFIRGVGTPVIIAGSDSSTATYLNGVYLSRAAAIGPAFFDVERLEVLRGPQGTLYGRNATAGAVNIITRDPTEEFEAEARFILGNYDRTGFFGAVSGPLTDGFRARAAVNYENRDGYTTVNLPRGNLPASEPNPMRRVEARDDIAMRLTLQADLGPDAVLTLRGDYYRADDTANVFHFASLGYQDEVPNWLASREGSQTLAYFALKNQGRVTEARSRDIFADAEYFNDTEIWGITGDLEWALGDHTLSLIGSYRDTNPDFQNEFDLSDQFVNIYRRAEDHQQWSVEFQLTSPENRPFQWIFGGYYFEEENDITNDIFGDFWEPILRQGLQDLQDAGVIPVFPIVIPDTNLCCELHLNGSQETEAFAVYLDTSYEITDTLTLQLGGRYSWERRDGFQNFDLVFLAATPGGQQTRFAPNAQLFPNAISGDRNNVMPDPFGFVVAPVDGPETFDAFTPKIGLDWQVTPEVLLYATVQRGFKSGGYNIGSSQRTPFEPETIWAYEIGLKSQLLDDRLLFNMAGFRYDYTNLQAQDSIGNQPIIRNVGEARVTGFEVEAIATLSDYFRIDGSLTYVDAEFTDGELTEPLRPAPLSQPPGSVLRDLSGLRLPRAPEWKFNIGAQADIPIGTAGDLTLRADYGWQDKIFFTVFNIDAASEGSYGLLNARIAFTTADERYSFALFGNNLTDEVYFSNQILTGTVYGAEFVGPLGPPRTYGIEFRARF